MHTVAIFVVVFAALRPNTSEIAWCVIELPDAFTYKWFDAFEVLPFIWYLNAYTEEASLFIMDLWKSYWTFGYDKIMEFIDLTDETIVVKQVYDSL